MNDERIASTLEQILRSKNAPVLSYLNPPMSSDEELISFVERHWANFAVPQDLIELYRWHNGTPVRDGMDVRPPFFAHELGLCDFENIEETIAAD